MVQLSTCRQTSRLTLRRFELDDLDDLALLLADEDGNRYLYSEPRDRATTLKVLLDILYKPEDAGDDNLRSVAVELRETKQVIGEFILRWLVNEHRQAEIG